MECVWFGFDSDITEDEIKEIIEEEKRKGRVVAKTDNGHYILCDCDDEDCEEDC